MIVTLDAFNRNDIIYNQRVVEIVLVFFLTEDKFMVGVVIGRIGICFSLTSSIINFTQIHV